MDNQKLERKRLSYLRSSLVFFNGFQVNIRYKFRLSVLLLKQKESRYQSINANLRLLQSVFEVCFLPLVA